jgi:microcystin-dependent protein
MEGTIGEIRMFAANFAPKSWSYCNGALINIASNTALFSILGTMYGGNGTTNFGLPDLRSRVAVGAGYGPGLSPIAEGELAGTENVTLLNSNLAAHNHTASGKVTVFSNAGDENTAVNTFFASGSGGSEYASIAGSGMTMNNSLIQGVTLPTGNNYPVPVIQPYLAMNYIICMYGVYPQRP